MKTSKLAALAGTVALSVVLTGCSAAGDPDVVDVTSSTQIIDVRTPTEYDSGHLEGSINIDLQSTDFDDAVTELPLNGDYIVYCASGNRSATAVERMTGLGFESIIDAGGIADAANATGIDIITN